MINSGGEYEKMPSKKRTIFLLLILLLVLIIFLVTSQKPKELIDDVTIDENITENESDTDEVEVMSTNDNEREVEEKKSKNESSKMQEDTGIIHDDTIAERSERLSQFIATNHETLNSLNVEGQYENINWAIVTSMKREVTDDIEGILQNKKIYSQSMEIDFERIVKLLEIATDKNDPEAVLYIHRIFHDLDVEFNNYTPHNKYGFSNYDGGGENQLIIADYIEKHGH